VFAEGHSFRAAERAEPAVQVEAAAAPAAERDAVRHPAVFEPDHADVLRGGLRDEHVRQRILRVVAASRSV